MAPGYSGIIKKLGKNRVKLNEPLAKHTTFKIGGPADLFYEAKTEEELVATITLVRKSNIPYFILGNGSKVLVLDEGFRGIVIKILNCELRPACRQAGISNCNIIVSAGWFLPDLLKKLADKGLTGLEFMAGIPGTVGGAVRGNAGAWRRQISDKVTRVKILNENNLVIWLSKESCQFGYRQSRFKNSREIILAVEFELDQAKPEIIREQITTYLKQRQGQPKELSVGSVFVNPKPKAAAELIEACGLRGKTIGRRSQGQRGN
jgi:UDP-N-acetylmuramate dehydrogenase